MNTRWLVILGVFVLIIIAALWKWNRQTPPPPFHIPLAAGEAVSVWNFSGAYTGQADLLAKADAEIARLQKLISGSGQYSDYTYTLFVSVANQYDLMGDGKNELAYLGKALAISPDTGLAWHNAGQLFARLGAYRTALSALRQAAAVEPIEQYKRAITDFLSTHPQVQEQAAP